MTIPDQLVGFSKAVALDRVGGDQNLLSELASLFLKESVETLGALKQALAAQDARAVMELAHRLRGSASNFGAEATCNAAQRLESLGRSRSLQGGEEALAELETTVASLRLALAGMLSS